MQSVNKQAAVPITKRPPFSIKQFFPIFDWIKSYDRSMLSGDLLAGLVVAIMLVPQGMAYAMLAGLPPEVGLYASILPLIIYGLMGTSRSLAVGPVAIVSLLVASSVGTLAQGGTAAYWQLALTLAFMTGIIQIAMGLLRIGFLVNFLSHPVLSGFTSAAAIVIGFSQLKHLLGFSVPRFEYFYEQVGYTISHLAEINWVTLTIGLGSIAILLFAKYKLGSILLKSGLKQTWAIPLTKAAPLIVVVLGTLIVWAFGLNETAGVAIVGDVPAGLPSLTTPIFDLDVWQTLLYTAVTISLVGYMESISVGKSLASKRREKLDANQELVALGTANLGASFTGGYPVTGGISRSLVNFSAGARSGLASIVTAGLIILTLLLLTPLFYYLPQAVLSAIILVAVAGMVDFGAFRHTWGYNKADGISLAVTFAAVLIVGVESGILYGVAISLLVLVWRVSRPHIAVVGRLGSSEIYRNVLRHEVQTWPELIVMRIDESLYFANTKALEDTALSLIAEKPEVKDFVLVGTAINFIDASALETLEHLHQNLHDAGVKLHFAAIKGPVMDRLERQGAIDQFGRENFYLSTHDALAELGYVPD